MSGSDGRLHAWLQESLSECEQGGRRTCGVVGGDGRRPVHRAGGRGHPAAAEVAGRVVVRRLHPHPRPPPFPAACPAAPRTTSGILVLNLSSRRALVGSQQTMLRTYHLSLILVSTSPCSCSLSISKSSRYLQHRCRRIWYLMK